MLAVLLGTRKDAGYEQVILSTEEEVRNMDLVRRVGEYH